MEYLWKITTSNYIVWLKTILKNNQKSGRGYLSVLRRLKKKHVWKAWTCLFLLVLLLATTFVTIQYKVISNRVLNLSSTVVQVNFGIYCSSIKFFQRSIFWTNKFSPNFSSVCAELTPQRTSSFWKFIFANG